MGILQSVLENENRNSTTSSSDTQSTSDTEMSPFELESKIQILDKAIQDNFFNNFAIKRGVPLDETTLDLLRRYQSSLLYKNTPNGHIMARR